MTNAFRSILLAAALFSLQHAWAVDECGNTGPRRPCQITIDRTAPVSGKSVTVENETVVTVVLIKKSPFESCNNQVKREELPDVSPLAALLPLISGMAEQLRFSRGVSDRRTPEGQIARTPKERIARTPEDQIAQELDSIADFAQTQADAAEILRKDYEAEIEQLRRFYRTKYLHTPDASGDMNDVQFERDRAARQDAVAELTRRELPNTAAGEATYGAVLAEYAAYVRSAGATPGIISSLGEKINRARTVLDTLARAVSTLDAARAKMLSTLDYLKSLTHPEWEVRWSLPPDRNAKLTGSLGCTSDLSGKPTLDPPIVYTVSFQNTPRLSLTAGVLLSLVPRNSVGIESVVDDRAGSNTVTAHSEIRDHPGRPQVVPFSFMNLRLGQPWRWAGRNMTFNFASGVGVNSNNGGNAAEFFLGLSLGLGNLFVSAGSHIGHELRPANGYHLLDRPPAELQAVPTETPWKPGFGFAVSYRIPLK